MIALRVRQSLTLTMTKKLVVLATALLALGVVATRAHAKLCSDCLHHIGLVTFYQYSAYPNCDGASGDPINVYWWPQDPSSGPFANSKSGSVRDNLVENSGDTGNAEWVYVDQDYKADYKGVRTVSADRCKNEAVDAATDYPWADDRLHSRLWDSWGSNGGWFVSGDAHHDKNAGYPCFSHYSSSYDGPKRTIFGFWPSPSHWENWGNTKPVRQCAGARPTIHSNGWTAAMRNGHWP